MEGEREKRSEVRNRGRKVDERCGFNDTSLFPKALHRFLPLVTIGIWKSDTRRDLSSVCVSEGTQKTGRHWIKGTGVEKVNLSKDRSRHPPTSTKALSFLSSSLSELLLCRMNVCTSESVCVLRLAACA